MMQASIDEIALAAFLHDIGKFVQRAHGSRQRLSDAARRFEGDILPQHNGRYTHVHAIWTEEFFAWMEREGLSFPGGLNRSAVRNLAVFHHRPDNAVREMGGAAWIVAQADRLAAGLDRKGKEARDRLEGPADSDAGQEREPRTWDSFIRTPMRNPFSAVQLDASLGEVPRTDLPLAVLGPEREAFPQRAVAVAGFPAQYAAMWAAFQEEMRRICQLQDKHPFFRRAD